MLFKCLIFFFFSSRRRHTRLVSDWSSDVCSSDLALSSQLAVAVAGDEMVVHHSHRLHERVTNRGPDKPKASLDQRSEEHTSELQSLTNLVCRLLLEKKHSCRPGAVALRALR